MKRETEKNHRDMINSFHITEKGLSNQLMNSLLNIKNVNRNHVISLIHYFQNEQAISDLQKEVSRKQEKICRLRQDNETKTFRLKETHKEEVNLLEKEIWALKATVDFWNSSINNFFSVCNLVKNTIVLLKNIRKTLQF